MQSTQTPVAPHSVLVLPVTHVPPEAAEQHPPLHAWEDEHATVHVLVAVSHA